jgi:trehalose 6-phosphate phosphatase
VNEPGLLRPGADLAWFYARVASAPRRALLIDYDGTLAPLTADRRHAEPYPGTRSALVELAHAPKPTAVWIVSGRGVGDLARLARLEHVVDLWGSHGLERRTREGCWAGPAPDPAASNFLDDVCGFLAALGAGSLTERKLHGVAIHWRGSDPLLFEAAREALESRFAPAASSYGLEPLPFDGGLELRPRAFHKGQVVERAFAELGHDAAVAYLGDDRTDEDAFRALRGRGLPVLVRPEPRETLAVAWLRPPGEVLAFFKAWNAACSPPAS